MRFCLASLAYLIAATSVAAEPRTKVIVNGAMAPVYFNDGDTFRVLTGNLAGTKARLAGYNTLESFGPVHSWGKWSTRELYVNAKAATVYARRGIWRCSWDKKVDGYGRGLFQCPELAVHQIRAGFAHGMTVTAEPSPKIYLDAQRDAIRNRRGMWAGGVPKYILTSLHSLDERANATYTYNRLVSVADGHSERWIHSNIYLECQNVCFEEVVIASADLSACKTRLDSATSLPTWGRLDARRQVEVLEVFLMVGSVSAHIPKEERPQMRKALSQLVDAGMLKAAARKSGGCMIYTDFRRRFGGGKAVCLKLAR